MKLSSGVGRFDRVLSTVRCQGRSWTLVVGGVLGLSVALSVTAASPAATGSDTYNQTAASSELVTDYQPSQPTGWETPYTPALGGHVASKTLTYHHRSYRISLLGFGSADTDPDPVYEPAPSDPKVAFERTLGADWDRYYTFQYQNGLPPGASFTVESYGVWSAPHSVTSGAGVTSTGLSYGGDVYFVYHPGPSVGAPAIDSDLQFIQVLYNRRGTGSESFVDSMRHNPFYGEGAGLTSIDGNQIVNFDDFLRQTEGAPSLPTTEYRAETFLAQDTGIKDPAGKDVVKIYGGITWGFVLQPTQ
ncbi:MAG: hypothetical protein ACLP0J_03355 [Solirubrobacteraceae bacterium]